MSCYQISGNGTEKLKLPQADLQVLEKMGFLDGYFYVVHIDSRYSIDEFLSIREGILRKKLYTKIIVPKALFEECREFLYNRNYTLDYLFPSEIQYRAERIRRIFE
jgi:hypothetical protein